jgi:hypothetical protein
MIHNGGEALDWLKIHARGATAAVAAGTLALGGVVYLHDRATDNAPHSPFPVPSEIQTSAVFEAGAELKQNEREVVAQEAGVEVDALPPLKSIYSYQGLNVLVAGDSKANITPARIHHIHLVAQLLIADLEPGTTRELNYPAPYDQKPVQYVALPNSAKRFLIFSDTATFSAEKNNDNALKDHANLATVVDFGQSAEEYSKDTTDAILRICAVLQNDSNPDERKTLYGSLGLVLSAGLAKRTYEAYRKAVDTLNKMREHQKLEPLGTVTEEDYRRDSTVTIG